MDLMDHRATSKCFHRSGNSGCPCVVDQIIIITIILVWVYSRQLALMAVPGCT